jgi:flagellar basal-body rod protein FlgC
MGLQNLFAANTISASGMAAERLRMEVIANNIANANSTRGPDGKPFRRQEVIFSAVLDQALSKDQASRGLGSGLGGVEVAEIVEDQSELQRVHMPSHPDADAEGYVLLPNVKLPIEMVNLLTASRAYEANVRASTTFRQMNEAALQILRS